MELVKRIFFFMLKAFFVLLLLGGAFLLAWWFHWPLFTGFMILCGLGSLVALYFAVRQLRLWRDKQRYVRHVLTSDPARQSILQQTEETELDQAWNKGIERFAPTSGFRRDTNIHSQPWVLLLGQRDCGAHSLIDCAANGIAANVADTKLPFTADTVREPLQWTFLPETVLLRVDSSLLEPEANASWEALLTHLLNVRRKESINSLLITIDVPRLLNTASPDALRQYGHQLRGRIHELLTLAEARIPVTVLVTMLDTLPGMTPLLTRLPASLRTRPLGTLFAIEPETAERTVFSINPHECARRAVSEATQTLRRYIVQESAQGQLPDGDDLSAPAELNALEKGLTAFLEALFRRIPHSITPSLRGILFTSALQTTASSTAPPVATAVPCFIADYFSRQLPDDRALHEPVHRADLRARLALPGVAALYLLLFALCGLTAASTIFNWQTLRDLPPVTSADSDRLETTFLRLQHLENAKARWWLPSLGLDRINETLNAEKARFAALMQGHTIPAVLNALQRELPVAQPSQPGRHDPRKSVSTGATLPLLERLLWMQEAVALRQQSGSSAALRERPFPGVTPTEHPQGQQSSADLWSLDFGDTFLAYVDRADDAALRSLNNALNANLRQALGGNEQAVFEQIMSVVNATLPHAAVPLSRFWPGVPAGSRVFKSVPPAYTAVGYAQIRQQMERLYSANRAETTSNTFTTFTSTPFWQNYITRYAEMWADFARHSDRAWQHVSQTTTLDGMAATLATASDPHWRLLHTMADELAPLRTEPTAPSWVQDVFVIRALLNISRGTDDPANRVGTLSILYDALMDSATDDVRSLRDHLQRTRNLNGLLEAVRAVHQYQNALLDVRQTLFNTQGALELAKIQYGGKTYGEPDKTSYALADKALRDVATNLGVTEARKPQRLNSPSQAAADGATFKPSPLETASPAFYVLRGPLRFLASALTATAALELQELWQATVVAQAALLPPNPGAEPLFGAQGLVTQFLTTQAEPFLTRRVGAYTSRMWGPDAFPFTFDFLDFLQQGQTANVNAPKETYSVTLHSQSGSVNPDSAERLDFFRVEMLCQKQRFTLTNENFPREETFDYQPKNCGSVTLTLNFPSLTLVVPYTDFPSFVQDFNYGERNFGPADFPDVAEHMEKLALRSIVIRILPDNTQDLLLMQNAHMPSLPERITQVW